jgi:serine/threonine protein kinase
MHCETGKSYAVKIIDSSFSVTVEREIRLLRQLDHPHIIKLIEVVEEDGLIFVVLEYCEGGTLLDMVLKKKLKSLCHVKRLFRQVASAVGYLHTQGISHGDIKPENVVLTGDGNAKLIDFGYCKECLIGTNADKTGTVKYSAPEVLRSGAYNTRKADAWSLGILLFVMVTGNFPYSSADDTIVQGLVLKGELAPASMIGRHLSDL